VKGTFNATAKEEQEKALLNSLCLIFWNIHA